LHEMSLAVNIVNIGIDTARKNKANVINEMVVEVGTLSGIIPTALEFCYGSACKGTIAEGSRLSLIIIAGEAHCPSCGHIFEADNMVIPCPECKDLVFDIKGGRDLKVKKINVD